ncbi:CHAT domain-containing protein [Lactarius indigo]|nr:CHAT domain-containing protein [Lactarius indigo]
MSIPQHLDSLYTEYIHKLNFTISYLQYTLSSSPRLYRHRINHLSKLSTALFERHVLSNDKDDLDKSILHLTEVVLIQPCRYPSVPVPNVLEALLFLALALLRRSDEFKQPNDVASAVEYLRHLRDQPHEAFRLPHHGVTTSLVEALALQVELGAGNVMHNIEEMAMLCRELLTLGRSEGDTIRSITLLARAVGSTISPEVLDQPLDPVIETLREASTCKDLQDARLALAHSLGCRYFLTYASEDYDEAVSILEEIIGSNPCENIFATQALQLVTYLAMLRSLTYETPEYSEEAIYRTQAFLSSSLEEPSGIIIARLLENGAKQRFRFFGSANSLEGARSDHSSSSQPAGDSLADRYFRVHQRGEEMKLLEELLSKIRDGNITDIEEAIELGRTLVASFRPSGRAAFYPLHVLADILAEGFRLTGKIGYLEESIIIHRRTLEFPLTQPVRHILCLHLSRCLITRSQCAPARRVQDVDESVELLSFGANAEHASLPDRFQFACSWAYVARHSRHISVTTAYENAMSLMQNTLLFAPTLQLQHDTLSVTWDSSLMLPLDYASYHIELGQLKEAVETLERGRALLWSEMRHLRTSNDQLLKEDSHLGHMFAAVNRDLEALTKSISPSLDLNIDIDGAEDLRAVDSFGRLLLKQRRLLKKRDELISQIRDLPRFKNFCKTPSFDTLCSAASCGPVIMINHSSWHSDILILHNTNLSLITTPNDFYFRARSLQDDLLDARNKHGPDSDSYSQILEHILSELYDLIGKPVIDKLRQLNVPEQSRVWWCPTSVFCSLPLHAMGPIPSDSGDKQYFLDLYIPSYTPTLSALAPQSDYREPGSPTSDLPSLLLVAHFNVPSPDVPLSEVCEDVKVVQALTTRLPVKCLVSEGATTASVIDGLRDHRFVHFICHGTLKAGKPFDAGFELHGNERLTLLDIVRSRLPVAEFAFLSACHTAELTDGSSADEGLHLAAAVQYCGFRSVVGTMWAMANEDGPDLAKHFYKSMFQKREYGEAVPYYKRSAGALRDAVKKLRKKRGVTLERWVNFVHYGA